MTVVPWLERPAARLVLADGATFAGEGVGALRSWPEERVVTGELVFNTALSGYQEILSDPSYAGQVLAFTAAHIGNYGVTETDAESPRPACRAIVVRSFTDVASSWRASSSLEALLVAHDLAGIAGVDTRRLTRHIREAGAMSCAIGTGDPTVLHAAARREPGTFGQDLVAQVTTPRPYIVAGGPRRVVAYDFGIKATMLARLKRFATVEVVPATTSAEAVLERAPDGVVLSNGPGDPAALPGLVTTVRALLGSVPVFGICLGHQLLAEAIGGTTYKLQFGHHGANHPVRSVATGVVEITSQNHGYAVAPDSIATGAVSHVNLNDGVIEGLALPSERAFSVQYHPEAGPGPHDSFYLFDAFEAAMDRRWHRGSA
jgi:carbamoyl-phosphate synthase small subunit